MKSFLLTISGNIGSGKTTLAKLLSDKLDWKVYYEPFVENPYLQDFYKEMDKWSFHSQIYFLIRRFGEMQDMIKTGEPLILDRSIYEDAEIFAKNLFRSGMMNERDYKCYRELYSTFLKYLKPPDFLIYLRSDVDLLMERIGNRSRDIEKNISKDYISALNENYEEWISEYKLSEIFVINVGKMSFLENEEHLNLIVETVRNLYYPKLCDRKS